MPRKKPDIPEPGKVDLEDAPKPAAPPKPRGRPPKGGRQTKETPPRSHHPRPGPNADQVKGALSMIGSTVQSIAHRMTTNPATGESRIADLIFSERELVALANAVGDELMKRPRAAQFLSAIGAVSKVSPMAKLAAELAAPRLARRGMIPPAIAMTLGASEDDVAIGLRYREEQQRSAAERGPRQPRPVRVPGHKPQTTTPPVTEPGADRNTGDEGLPNVGVPPEAYVAPPPFIDEPLNVTRRGGGGASSLSGT